ncbi:MAG: SH3 domain-containing protein, partial [Ignavibacteriales bacterium]|nr:SH3 domain-containing protein [Ignavibacteriales bacterium]
MKLLLPVLLLLIASCAPVDEQDAMLKATVQSLKEQYAPDRRVAVFDITWERYGNALVMKGEVDNPKAKEDLLAALKTAGSEELLDSIKILPDPELGVNLYGIVTISVANVRSSPGQPEELSTQVMMGMVVKLLKKRGGWYYVQSHDKYLGWLEDDAFHMTTAEGVDAWTAANKVITTSHFALIRDRPDARALPVS